MFELLERKKIILKNECEIMNEIQIDQKKSKSFSLKSFEFIGNFFSFFIRCLNIGHDSLIKNLDWSRKCMIFFLLALI